MTLKQLIFYKKMMNTSMIKGLLKEKLVLVQYQASMKL